MLKIGIMGGSTRPSRKAPAVVEWVSRILKSREEEEFELVDTTDCKLLSSMNAYRRYHTTTYKTHAKTWSAKIASRQTGKACGALCIVECGVAERFIAMRSEPGTRAFTPTIEEEPA